MKAFRWCSEKPGCLGLHEAILSHFDDFLFMKSGRTGWPYESTDAKVGINVDALEQSAPAIRKLMAVDPRGGFSVRGT